MRGVSLLQMPSDPSATLTPASSSLRNGAMPAPSFWLEMTLCTIEQPASPISSMSSSVTQIEWAIVVPACSRPRSCM